MKPVAFLGRSLEAVRSFPRGIRREVGFQIDRLQRGLDPDDWKPLKAAGSGVREIRVRDKSGAYRVIYVATFEEAVFVLHAFQKKTRATPKLVIELAAARYRALTRKAIR